VGQITKNVQVTNKKVSKDLHKQNMRKRTLRMKRVPVFKISHLRREANKPKMTKTNKDSMRLTFNTFTQMDKSSRLLKDSSHNLGKC